ncbi:MAG: ABC transporter substrate-binding protein [Deltaproteobacteria bacterium]|nr:ABC transporter substrate-binding protein [Deltaproteobacteria bacterium]
MKKLVVIMLAAAVAMALGGPSALAAGKDTLVIGVSSDIHTLDPAVTMANWDWRQSWPCYNRLVRYKQGSTEVEPSAAESWTVSDDGKTWTFKIRKGIKFNDGGVLDAKAVKFSFDRLFKLAKGPSEIVPNFESCRVVDDYTFEIKLASPFGPFIQTLACHAACLVNPNVMKHEKDGDMAQAWLSAHCDGSGPYTLTEWRRGQRAVLEAKPDYWSGAPKLKKVIIRFMSESADRRMALERGDIDIAETVEFDQLPALEKNKDILVLKNPSMLVDYVYLNNQKEGLNNPLVRKALNYAVDYQGIIDNVLGGNGIQMRGPVPKGLWGHKEDAFQFKRDVEKAKALLKEAGFEKGLTLTMIYSESRPTWAQIAAILQSNFRDIGVDLKLEMMANATLRDKVNRGDYELCTGAWTPDYADPSMFMNFWFDSKRWGLPGNRSFYKNPKVDELIYKAISIVDQAERTKLYNQAQDIIMDEAPYIFLYQVNDILPMRKNVKGYVFNPMMLQMYNFEQMYKE